MSEELKVEQTEQEVSQVSEIEQKALEMGWRPKEEFDGDETEFIDAKEFVRRQPLFDKISHQSREIKEVRKALEALKTHYTTVRESEYERALTSLKQARKTALSDGDGDRFDALDDEIKVVEKQVESIKAVKDTQIVQDSQEHPEFTSWKNQNRWYESTGYMRKFADDFGTELAARGVPPAEVLKQVAQAVRKEFPGKFSNPNKENAAPVNSGASGGNQRSASIEGSLTEQERTIMNTLVRSGTITKEKYLADLKAIKERS
jgi:hypothetical protein